MADLVWMLTGTEGEERQAIAEEIAERSGYSAAALAVVDAEPPASEPPVVTNREKRELLRGLEPYMTAMNSEKHVEAEAVKAATSVQSSKNPDSGRCEQRGFRSHFSSSVPSDALCPKVPGK